MEGKFNIETVSIAPCEGGPSVALDYSNGELAVALELEGCVEAVSVEHLPPKRFAEAVSVLDGLLSSQGLGIPDVLSWTCGTGPGSFTALRASTALLMGFAAGSSGKFVARGVPSVAAVGAKVSKLCPDADSCAVLFDAKGGRVARYSLAKRNGVLSPPEDAASAMSPAEAAELKCYDVVAGFSRDRNVFASLLPGLGEIFYLERFPIEELLRIEGYPWGEGLDSPLYCRPPTDAKPLAGSRSGGRARF